MMTRTCDRGGLCLAVVLLSATVSAQFDNRWVEFAKDPGSLAAGMISDVNNETDMAWGDLDKDGWIDVVVVRKEPFTSPGKRSNVLLMNENGVLTDRTTQYASTSDVLGDQGFRTVTNDRDAVLVDIDQDGWLDVVTATTISDGDPKSLGHPRVYRNLGRNGSGAWKGLKYEESRIPQLFQYDTGNPENPRFCSVAAGDVTGDGYPDLYFGDYDSSGVGGGSGQPADKDMNDRLLINDGNGFFTDQSQSRMSATMLNSAFGMAVEVVDMNLDGVNDVVKDTALNPPQYVAISYNNPASVGSFNIFDNTDNGSGAPYHIDVGDLNNDGRPDVIISDDASDRFRFNTGVDFLGRVTFSGGAGGHLYSFLSGNDDGFASNNLIVDLDGDGWNDTVHADVDVDITGYSRRTHIYHNMGGIPGATNIELREERQQSGNGGWLGAVGLLDSDLTGTHDIAAYDIDNDTDTDLIISRKDGTDVWLNQTSTVICQKSVGFQHPGFMSLTICGDDLTTAGSLATLSIANAVPNHQVLLAVGLVNAPFAFNGGFLVPVPILLLIDALASDGAGQLSLPLPGASGPPVTLYLQAVVKDGGSWEFSNAVELVIGT